MPEVLDEAVQDEEGAAQRVIQVIGVAPKAIKTDEEYEAGMSWLAKVVTHRKKIEAFFESLKKPIRVALKAVGDKEKSILEPLEKEQAALKQLTGAYFMKKKAEADEKQRKINEAHQTKVDKAVAEGKPVESIAPPKVVTQLATTVKGQDGAPTATMRLIKNWRLRNAPQFCQANKEDIYRDAHPELVTIPDSCWVLDRAKANNAAKSGLAPAFELYDVPSQAVNG